MQITGSRRSAIGQASRIVGAMLCATAICTPLLYAADVVTVRTPAGSVVSRTGTIVDYTASELRLQPPGARETAIPAEQIARIETTYTAAHEQAERLFAARDYKSAGDRFADAIRGEDRAWMRREMLARLVLCYRALGDGDSAGRVFLQLAKGDATTKQFASIPLAWRAVDPLVVSERQAREWLDAPGDSAANLLGASHLLAATDSTGASAVLGRLTTDRDVRIALLAETQRWRIERAGVTDAELTRRRAAIDRLAVPLRAGPYFVLAESLAAAGQTDAAVAAWMRLPIEFPDDRPLAAASLAAAAQALESAGRAEEAKLVLRERDRDFADSSAPRGRNSPRLPVPSNGAQPDDGR